MQILLFKSPHSSFIHTIHYFCEKNIFACKKYCVQAAVDDVLGQVNTQITDIKEKVMGVIPIKSKPTVLKKEE